MIADNVLASAMENFHFLRPLWLLAIVPVLIISRYFRHLNNSAISWRSAINEDLLKHLIDVEGNSPASRWETRLPWLALIIGWSLACIALAGPSWEKLPQPVHQKQDALVIVFDLSMSMLAEDIKPSRLVRARHKILDILEQRKEGFTALIAYSGDAHIVSPLTDDNPTVANLAPALSPEMMPVYGSDPYAATQMALELLKNSGIAHGNIILITDDVSEDKLSEISDSIASNGHQLAILGVGTSDGAPIPTSNGFMKDRQGNIIVPQLNRERLEKLAEENSGRYTDVSLGGDDIRFLLQPIAKDSDRDAENIRLTDRQFDQWKDRGPLLVFLLLPFALLAFRRGWLLAVIPLFIFEPNTSLAYEWQDLWQRSDQQAVAALEQGNAERAAKLFEDKQWRAIANYKNSDFPAAEKDFSGSDSADAHYNRGNALARAGKIDEAIEAYDSALEKQENMEDAIFNKQLLEKMKQQQDQQQSDNKEQNSDSEENQKSDGESDQDQDQDQDQNSDQDKQSSDQNKPSEDDSQQDSSNQNKDRDKEEEKEKEAEKERDQQNQSPEDEQQEKESEAEKESEKEQQETPLTEAQQRQQDQQDQQQKQAMEQWLRKIPDEPSGLLRRKFRYESKRRQQQAIQEDQQQW